MDKVYDIIVLGAGPAGLAAASYAGRARMDTLLIEGTKDGGQIVITNEIENYPGSLEEESGPSLIARMTKQVEKFGADRVTDTIVDVELEGKVKHPKVIMAITMQKLLLSLLVLLHVRSAAQVKKNSPVKVFPTVQLVTLTSSKILKYT